MTGQRGANSRNSPFQAEGLGWQSRCWVMASTWPGACPGLSLGSQSAAFISELQHLLPKMQLLSQWGVKRDSREIWWGRHPCFGAEAGGAALIIDVPTPYPEPRVGHLCVNTNTAELGLRSPGPSWCRVWPKVFLMSWEVVARGAGARVQIFLLALAEDPWSCCVCVCTEGLGLWDFQCPLG